MPFVYFFQNANYLLLYFKDNKLQNSHYGCSRATYCDKNNTLDHGVLWQKRLVFKNIINKKDRKFFRLISFIFICIKIV